MYGNFVPRPALQLRLARLYYARCQTPGAHLRRRVPGPDARRHLPGRKSFVLDEPFLRAGRPRSCAGPATVAAVHLHFSPRRLVAFADEYAFFVDVWP